jgi:hypothetical protein
MNTTINISIGTLIACILIGVFFTILFTVPVISRRNSEVADLKKRLSL